MDGQDIGQWIAIACFLAAGIRNYGDAREWKKGTDMRLSQLEKDAEKRDRREDDHYERICQVLDKHA